MTGHVVAAARSCPLCPEARGAIVWTERGGRYLRCVGCGVTYSDLSAEDHKRARHNVWDQSGIDPDVERFYGSARALAHERFLNMLGPPNGRALLDVGCGLGYLLARAQARGWLVRGCDTSARWVEVANARLAGNPVRLGPVHALDPSDRFDVVCAWDVIEHVFEPLPFLRSIAALLSDDGIVFLRTPNLAYVLPLYRLRRAIGHTSAELGPTNHVVYYTSRTLRRSLSLAGMALTRVAVLPSPQVVVPEWEDRRFGRASVHAKRAWARLSDSLAARTGGRIAIGSDLDVFARRAP